MYSLGRAGKSSQVSTNYVLQDRTLSARLTANHHNLRKIDGILNSDGREDILEFVDEPDVKCQRLRKSDQIWSWNTWLIPDPRFHRPDLTWCAEVGMFRAKEVASAKDMREGRRSVKVVTKVVKGCLICGWKWSHCVSSLVNNYVWQVVAFWYPIYKAIN